VNCGIHLTRAEGQPVANRWGLDSDLMRQIDGRMSLKLTRTFEYGVHIIHALESQAVYRMHLNVLNESLIDNLPAESCVEVPCVVDRLGIRRNHVGNLPVQLAALCRRMAYVQTLSADAFLEKISTKLTWPARLTLPPPPAPPRLKSKPASRNCSCLISPGWKVIGVEIYPCKSHRKVKPFPSINRNAA
jgi:hypothetical protein